MGKTAAGAVWLDAGADQPYEFYQYFVNVDDRDVDSLHEAAHVHADGRDRALRRAAGRRAARRQAGARARRDEVVHGADAAGEADHAASAAFGGAGASDASVPTYEVTEPDGAIKVVDLLAAAGLAASKSAARRLVEQGGVRVGDRKVASIDEVVRAADVGDGALLHAGKKNIRRIVFAQRR